VINSRINGQALINAGKSGAVKVTAYYLGTAH